MRRYTRLISSISLVILASCSSGSNKPTKDEDLVINFAMTDWASTDPRESDRAWVHRARGDVMMVNSFCGEFQSLPLEALALKTFESYDSYKPLGKRALTWHEREAFEMEAEAYVDGVKVLIHLRNYRRDHCYYDFVLISPRTRSEDSITAFNRMVEAVEFDE